MDIYQLLKIDPSAKKEDVEKKYSALLESYKMVELLSEDIEVSNIAKIKIKELQAAAVKADVREFNLAADFSTDQTEIAIIKNALSDNKAEWNRLAIVDILNRVDKLEESGEKHYLQAIYKLKTGKSLEDFSEAIISIEKAMKYDPTYAVYLTLRDAINYEMLEFQENQRKLAEKNEKKRIQIDLENQQKINELKKEDIARQQKINDLNRNNGGFSSCTGGCLCITIFIFLCWIIIKSM